MMLFWVICAGLVAIALAFVLPTLLDRSAKSSVEEEKKEANLDVYRDQISELEADLRNGIISQEQYEQDRDEIERRLLDEVSSTDKNSRKRSQPAFSRTGVYAIAFGIPALAVTLYLLVGNYSALSGTPTSASRGPSTGGPPANGQMSQQQIEANVASLAKRLEQNPNDVDGWIMLGRSYLNLEKYSDASNAYAKAAVLKPNDVDILTDFAFTLAMTNGRQLKGEPYELVKKALRIDPQNAKALELAGSAEFQAKNYKQAIEYWEKALAQAPAGSELATTISQNISEAKAQAGTSAK